MLLSSSGLLICTYTQKKWGKLFMSSAVCKIEILDFPSEVSWRHGVLKTLFRHVYPISGISTSHHQLVPPFSLFLDSHVNISHSNIYFQWLMKGTTKLSCFMKSSLLQNIFFGHNFSYETWTRRKLFVNMNECRCLAEWTKGRRKVKCVSNTSFSLLHPRSSYAHWKWFCQFIPSPPACACPFTNFHTHNYSN